LFLLRGFVWGDTRYKRKRILEVLPTSTALKVGLTGGIGAGKTTVARIFATLGIPVYYADDRAKYLMTHDAALVGKIRRLLGSQAYLPDGRLNRAHVAQVVFSQTDMLDRLNQIVHPAVRRDYARWHRAQRNIPYTLYEAALIFETGGERDLDAVIEVFAPKVLRIRRVRIRDGLTRRQVLARMARQMDEREKRRRADYVIVNDGRRMLIPQVLDVHRMLLHRAQTKVD